MKFYYLKHEKTGKFLNQSKIRFLHFSNEHIDWCLSGTPTLYQTRKVVERHQKFFKTGTKIYELEL